MRTKFPENNTLPNILCSGQKLISKLGRIIIINGMSKRDKYDQVTYRIKYPIAEAYGYKMPESTSSTAYSRDSLQEMGVRLFIEKKKKEGRTK